jgi:5'-3' exonuclease
MVSIASCRHFKRHKLFPAGQPAPPSPFPTGSRSLTMGIPGYFSWVQRRYPNVVRDIEARVGDFTAEVGADMDRHGQHESDASGVAAAGDNLLVPHSRAKGLAAPPTFSCCNLFIDTNGIIHAGTHPPTGQVPHSEAEMFALMHAVLERIVSLAQPQHLVYISVDGVAPRAKINQQRCRRFLAARTRGATSAAMKAALQRLRAYGVAPAVELDEVTAAEITLPEWDHNAISPGTAFMARMMVALKQYVARRMDEARAAVALTAAVGAAADPAVVGGWGSPCLRVVFSGCDVPGEGEHKIMDFIRDEKRLRAREAEVAQHQQHHQQHAAAGQVAPGGSHEGDDDGGAAADDGDYTAGPLCNHCIYGEDADLIMLALGLHDPRVCVMRHQLIYQKNKLVAPESVATMPYVVVDLNLLRRHLETDMFQPLREHIDLLNAERRPTTTAPPQPTQEQQHQQQNLVFDIERAIDDFVLLGCACRLSRAVPASRPSKWVLWMLCCCDSVHCYPSCSPATAVHPPGMHPIMHSFLIGNDFLPSLPAMDIRLGSLELLLEIHRDVFGASGCVARSPCSWPTGLTAMHAGCDVRKLQLLRGGSVCFRCCLCFPSPAHDELNGYLAREWILCVPSCFL